MRWVQRRLIIAVLCLGSLIQAEDSVDFFTQVTDQYQTQKYDAVCALYENMEVKGHSSWYNVGNCWYQRGDYAHAIACWRRACKGASCVQKDDCLHNICVARRALGMPSTPDQADSQTPFSKIPPWPIQLLTLALWYLPFGVSLKSREKWLQMVYGLTLISVTLISFIQYQEAHATSAVIAQQGASLFVGPDERHHSLGTLSAGQEVNVCDSKDGWCRIRQGNSTGWVPERVIHRV